MVVQKSVMGCGCAEIGDGGVVVQRSVMGVWLCRGH